MTVTAVSAWAGEGSIFLVQLAAGGEVYVARAQLRPGGSRAPNQALQQTAGACRLSVTCSSLGPRRC